ncbi:MAG: adenylyl-sulfate kinase [Vicinamibacteraceae bacterium]
MSSSQVDPPDGVAASATSRAARSGWAGTDEAAELAGGLSTWPSHVLSADQAATLLRLLDGVYQPLAGFMTAAEAAGVRSTQTLGDGTWWPVPVILDVQPATAERLATGGPLVLREAEGRAVAVIREGRAWQEGAGWRVGGTVVGLQAPPVYDLIDVRLSPTEVGDEIARRGWRAAIAVPVERVLHRADVEALEQLAAAHDAGLVILGVVDAGVVADRDRYARLRALRAAVARFAPGRGVLVLDTRPAAEGRAGSAIDAVVARAFGCARVVAWDAADEALLAAGRRVGVAVDRLASAPPAPADSSAEARAAWTFPEVAAELDRQAPSAWTRGVTVFFTGLSGSGKSTIANALRVRLLEEGRRTVTLLDGDLVRTHLSSELGFSREHRTLNVRRIAFVAAEITRHGGVAICAPIAPYTALRLDARALVEAAGIFLLVYVATPIEVCEARDPKGLYQRARAGTLPEFTGVSDPYEVPDDADVTIDASRTTVAQAVDTLIAALEARGLLRPTTG